MTDGLNWGERRRGAVSPLFNSCLLLKAGHEFLKPTIWVSPSRVVALGRNVTIRCEGQDLGMEFVLCKAGHPNQQVQSVVPEGKMAEFPIASVGQEDGGSYTCYYRSITDQSHWSFPSNPVEIIVGGEGGAWLSGPAPRVSVGEAMAIWCRRQRQGVRFVLNKEGRHFPPVDSDGFGAVFPISNVSREDGGNYSCSYHSRSEPFAVSDPSDPMELVVRGEGYPKPNISGIPRRGVSVGEAMAIWCRRQRQGVRFVLNKEGRHFPPVDSDGFGAVFPISNVSREDGGNYSCSYHSRSEPFAVSDPSDPMELVCFCGGPRSGCWGFLQPARPASDPPLVVKGGGRSLSWCFSPSLLPDRRWFYSCRGNRPDPAWNRAGSHPPGQHGARYRAGGGIY
uniref:Ig-like domain-containing protein n=1 Tax=Gopherus agassizii TaxID=38772 RepID=A0A452J2A1_9SAUR